MNAVSELIRLNGHTNAHCVINALRLSAKESVTCLLIPLNPTFRFVLWRKFIKSMLFNDLLIISLIFIHFSAIYAKNPSNQRAFYMVIKKSMANVNSFAKYVKKNSIANIISLYI